MTTSNDNDTARTIGDASYDPDDDKLRLRAFARLDAEDYARAKEVGFRWAPRQELFYAMWSPAAEDLLREWCGEVGDEETSLQERAEERADRFEDYSESRQADGDAADKVAHDIAYQRNGQPILIGHHSEKRARADQRRIENGTRKAIDNWRTADYWTRRAQGAIAHAAYKDKPGVRARRIKKLEAERRRRIAEYTPHGPKFMDTPWGAVDRVPCVMVGNKGRGAHVVAVSSLPAREKAEARWVAHLDHRIAYERAMLEAQGGLDLLKPKARPKQPPLLNYRAPDGIDTQNKWRPGEPEHLGQIKMTKAQYKAVWNDYKGTRLSVDGSHRVRITLRGPMNERTMSAVFLTDSKEHKRPEESDAS